MEPVFTIPAGQDRVVTALFEPTELLEAAATLTLHGVDGALGSVVVTGTGGKSWSRAHTLHPVIDGDTVVAEPDAAGGAAVRSLSASMSLPALPESYFLISFPFEFMHQHTRIY